jgi:dTDP-4-dehydrorhamnose 3,5-epimerase
MAPSPHGDFRIDPYPSGVQIRHLSVPGAVELTPTVHRDERGRFLEWFRADVFEKLTGHPFPLAQANCSVSSAGTLRGIHFAEVPPGQGKYVTCLRGAAVDVVVDLRTGSPCYGRWDTVLLDDQEHRAVWLPEGLGHGFMALSDNTVVSYLLTTPYAPEREHAVHPLDPAIGIEWPTTGLDGRPLRPVLSDRDASAPTLEEVRRRGLLPEHAAPVGPGDDGPP